MANAKRKFKAKAHTGPDAKVAEEGLLEYGRMAMTKYAIEVNEDRSVPDFYDGLKPVARKILYGAHTMNIDERKGVKTARLSGEVMGKYHPHGDASINDAIEGLVTSAPHSPLIGKGNWGTVVDNAAAPRYTNVLLSPYGHSFFDKHYFNKEVTPFIPNYDDQEVMPVVLPAMVPNILINGTNGIGVGMNTIIPSFTALSVVQTVVDLLDGEDIEPKDYVKRLEFNYAFGGYAVDEKENRKAIRELFANGKGTVRFASHLEINEDKRQIRWADFPPNLGVEKAVEAIKLIDGVDRVVQSTDPQGVSYTITWSKSIGLGPKGVGNKARMMKAIVAKTSSRFSYQMNVAETRRNKEGKREVRFHFHTPIDALFRMWIKRRVKLEVASLAYRIEKQKADIAYVELLIYAISKLDIIFKAIKTKEPAEYMTKHMKVMLEQANMILDRQVRSLSQLNEDAQKAKLKAMQEHLKQLQAWADKPVKKVRLDMKAILEALKKGK